MADNVISTPASIFGWLRTCPALADLYSIAATEEAGNSVVLPVGSSERREYNESLDVVDGYECDIVPLPSVYEEYQINLYKPYDTKDTTAPELNVNVLSFEEARSVCDWIAEQDEAGNLPSITGKQVISVDCLPFVPQVRYVIEELGVVAYFITVRVRYVNTAKRRCVSYDNGND